VVSENKLEKVDHVKKMNSTLSLFFHFLKKLKKESNSVLNLKNGSFHKIISFVMFLLVHFFAANGFDSSPHPKCEEK
jgi:hypothetical protein